MNLQDIAKNLGLDVKTQVDLKTREATGGYVGDMLSDVMANSHKGDIWITVQIHKNIIPVASMKELAGIIIVNGRNPEKETLMLADEEKIPIMVTEMDAFTVVGRLNELRIGK